jgi:peroxiredoxin
MVRAFQFDPRVYKLMTNKPNCPLLPGATAPAFSLYCTPDQLVALGDFRGRPVVLAFYPADWSPVCGDQMV